SESAFQMHTAAQHPNIYYYSATDQENKRMRMTRSLLTGKPFMTQSKSQFNLKLQESSFKLQASSFKFKISTFQYG
ncbi:hypothetical protein HAX54_028264, partial [Datura stramonium]|nr:hypothetical protein [Datura stramonium]